MKSKITIVLSVIIVILLMVIAFILGKVTSKTSVNAENDQKENQASSNILEENSVTLNFSDDEVANSLQRLLELYGAANGNPISALTSRGLTFNLLSDGGYAKTDKTFSSFLENMSRLCTENFVRTNDKFSFWFKDDGNGNLLINTGSGTGCTYVVNSVTKIEGNTYTADVSLIPPSEIKLPYTAKFTIANSSLNECVIDALVLTANEVAQTTPETTVPQQKVTNFTEDQVCKSLARLLDIYGSANGSPMSALTSRGLNITVTDVGMYSTTNKTFSSFLENMSRVCTENFVRTNEKFSFWYKENENGYLLIHSWAGTGCAFEVVSATKVADNTYTLDVNLIPPSGDRLPYTARITVAENQYGDCVVDSMELNAK